MTFWNQWDATVHWLKSIGKPADTSDLWVHGKGLGPLSPWFDDPTARLTHLYGWTDETSVEALWKYVSVFGQGRIESLRVPCGNEAWVEYYPQKRIGIRAPNAHWLWHAVLEAMRPDRWEIIERRNWQDHGRKHEARCYPWGFSVFRRMRPGWQEWTLRIHPSERGRLERHWADLVPRLGWRPVRIGWHPASDAGKTRLALGVETRVDEATLLVPQMAEIPPDYRNRSLAGLRLESVWEVPHWGSDWAARVSLKKAGRPYPHLEARFYPAEVEGDDRFLRAEVKRLPILELSALPLVETVESGPWQDLVRWIEWHTRAQSLMRACRDFARHHGEPKRRLPSDWRYSRLESDRGRWVIRHQIHPIRIDLSWPGSSHPGHISVSVGGVARLDLDDLDPSGLIDRWDPHWQYWQTTVNRLLVSVGDWIASQEMLPD
jgi:hypothetical protein